MTSTIFFTGGTGVIGRHAIPGLIGAGHRVTAIARHPDDRRWLQRLGGRPVEVDLFDRDAVSAAVDGHDVVVHMATSIPPQDQMTRRTAWSTNDRLRSEATANLVDAAVAHGVAAFVQQSITLVYADGGDRWLDEDSPVDPVWGVLDSALTAEDHVARFASNGGRGISLRFSSLYGPGRASREYAAAVAARKLPIIGSGANYGSHLHVADAGSAVVAAIGASTGVYNVTDDTPVTRRAELDALADVLGVKRPRSLPRWLARVVVGGAANLLSVSHRVSNERFRAATGWTPAFGSVIDGWRDVVPSPAASGRA